jgi:hypothetical protein
MMCQACGVEAPTKYVAFHQNIGLLVMRFSKSVEGDLCKSCVHKYFWQLTGTNLVLGWWGIISFVLNTFFILNNVGRYIFCLGMEPVPPGATQPVLTEEAFQNLKPHTEHLIERMNRGDDFDQIVEDTAMRAAVSPGQVVLYVQAMAAVSENAQQQQ